MFLRFVLKIWQIKITQNIFLNVSCVQKIEKFALKYDVAVSLRIEKTNSKIDYKDRFSIDK